jgi:GNAT superfamily N-acetyltransferase
MEPGFKVSRFRKVSRIELEAASLSNCFGFNYPNVVVVAFDFNFETLQNLETVKSSVQRATQLQADAAFALIEEYYDAVGVVVRDDRAALKHYLASADSPIWIACVDEVPAGCVMLRPLPQIPQAAEVKRLYVRPAHRGLHLAHVLMQAVEDHARREGFEWLYLDTKDDLHTAIRFYLSTGYQPCPRYNDNPQATLFLRKQL